MKQVTFKRKTNPKKRTKSMVMNSRSEDSESITVVEKSFSYKVSKTNLIDPKVEAPQIYIVKSVDTKKRIEKFNFQVKGCFYINQNRMLMRVNFHHMLDIKITWKKKIFSPKKSAVLTE